MNEFSTQEILNRVYDDAGALASMSSGRGGAGQQHNEQAIWNLVFDDVSNALRLS